MPVQRRCLNETCSFNKKGKFDPNSDSCRDCSYNIEETVEVKPKKKKTNIYSPVILLIAFLVITIVLIYKSYDSNKEGMADGNITSSVQETENKEMKINFGLMQNKQSETILTVNGSETMGSEMMPIIIENYFKSKGATNIEILKDEKSKKIAVNFNLPNKSKLQSVYINLQDSKTAFEALLGGQSNLVMSSRRITPEELTKFKSAGLGNLSAYYAENVISLEAAVIVNSSNSIAALDRSQLTAIFTGQITDWAQVGGKPGKINLYGSAENNELYGTFEAMVAGGKPFAQNLKKLPGFDKVAQEVAKDNNSIAFLNIPSAGKNKILAISEGGNPPVFPNEMNIATEDYPLSNRLYLYCSSSYKSSYSRELIDFALSEEGQNYMPKVGFISNNIKVETTKGNQNAVWENNALKERHMQIVSSAEGRLNLNFRFDKNTSVLDNKALKDIERVVRFLNSGKYSEHKIILIGFADNTGDYDTNLYLSEGRANEVKKQLVAKDPNLEMRISTEWFGREQPIASNDDDEGKNKNRRVEIWLVKK